MARPDFRAVAARRLSEEGELSRSLVSLLSAEGSRSLGVRHVPVDRIEPNPENPRLLFEESALEELASSIREHGVLQPILVRPAGRDQYQLVAGERRWRAAIKAGLATVPALVEELDDDAALEIAVIENLQREDLSPLEEATIYDKMVKDHGYSIRKLAQKLGKDKGYLENRLRLADAPAGDPRPGVRAQRHPVACLRADEGPGPEEAETPGGTGRERASSRSSSSASASRVVRGGPPTRDRRRAPRGPPSRTRPGRSRRPRGSPPGMTPCCRPRPSSTRRSRSSSRCCEATSSSARSTRPIARTWPST